MTCARIDVVATQAGGTLTIGGHAMHRAAFAVTSVSDLWGPDQLRGGDLLIPGRPGVLALPRRRTVRKVALPMVLDGRFQVDGSPSGANELVGLKGIITWLNDNLIAPAVGDGTRALTLTDPAAGDDLTGRVTVEGIEVGNKVRGLWLAVLDITLPDGRLA